MKLPDAPFVRRAHIETDDLVGARWWNEALVSAETSVVGRRSVLGFLGIMGGACAVALGVRALSRDEEISLAALDLQQQEGWSAGNFGAPLTFPGATPTDIAGSDGWRASLTGGRLAEQLRPVEPRLVPFFRPTLFQVLEHTSASSLRAQLTPISTTPMQEAFGRAEGLRSQFESVQGPRDVALVVDLPGADTVAAAAALCTLFAPVFLFDNWPHPRGVVASHLLMAAALFYRPTFQRANTTRPQPAPPAFIFDSNRLGPVPGGSSLFDNRYVANLPSADALKRLGVARVLYVRPAGASLEELDDLNEDFVGLERGGVPVRAVALGDFQRDPAARDGATPRYYWGGSPGYHVHFWPRYGWYSPPRAAYPARVSPPPPGVVSRADGYRPAWRPTVFSSRTTGGAAGIGKQKPSGFGRVSFRASGSSSRSAGSSWSRSGSWGRSRSSWGG